MKKIFNVQFISVLLVVFGILGFTQYALSWVAPTGPNVPMPINVSSTQQAKGGYDIVGGITVPKTDINPPAADAHVTLKALKTDLNKAGLFTEGFLSLGHITTFGYIGANLAKVVGNTVASRAPLLLTSGSTTTMTNIVLMNGSIGAPTLTKTLGVWSEKQNGGLGGWADTRIKNAYFNKLIIGGDPFRIFNYMDGGPQQITASYTKRFMGFLTQVAINPATPATYDPDYHTGVPLKPVNNLGNWECQSTNDYGAYAPYPGIHKYCMSNDDSRFKYEAVPITTLDVAGESDFGNGGTCIIRNTDECPLGSYLQKIGSYRNNVCRAFNGTCTAPNPPNPTLNDGFNGAYGAAGVAWIRAIKIPNAQNIGQVNLAQECSVPNMTPVGVSGIKYFFANPLQNLAIDLDGPDGEAQAGTVIYIKDSSMTASPSAGVYRVLFDTSNSGHHALTVNGPTVGKFLMQIGEAGEIVYVYQCI